MKPFVRETGVAAPLLRKNIDTDQITPGFTGMKVQKTGFGDGLFYNWRYRSEGVEDPGFVLNQEPYRHAKFLLAGDNFGCGSSREFAVWALRDFGIRAVLSSSFGAIFSSNCYINGLIPILLPEDDVVSVAEEVERIGPEITVDLEENVVLSPSERAFPFTIPAFKREQLMEGLDAIDATRKREPLIAAFQAADALKRPWIYPEGGS